MSASDEVRDPWGYVVAAAAGGATWALFGFSPVGALVGAVVAGGVFGTKVVAGAVTGIRHRYPEAVERPRQDLPVPPPGSAGDYWIRRAESTVVSLRALTDNRPDGGLAGRIAQVDDHAADVVASMRQVAGRLTVLEGVVAGVDPQWLAAERARLEAEVAATHDDQESMARADLEAARAAVVAQIESYRRLCRVRDALVARLQSTTLGLEGLVTSLAEVVTLAPEAGGDGAARVLDDLTGELDAMRMALLEVAALSRGELGGTAQEPPPVAS